MREAVALVTQIASIVLALIGLFFFLVGTVGVMRLPDFYCRTHAATKCDTLGAGSILLSLAVYQGFTPDTWKLIVMAIFVLMSSPTAGHAISRAAYVRGLAPWVLPEEGGPEAGGAAKGPPSQGRPAEEPLS